MTVPESQTIVHWTSPTLALLWKEWRQQWWVFLSLACLAPILLLSIARRSVFGAAVTAGLIVWGVCPIMLAANTFAGERDAGTDDFLYSLPRSRGSIFRVKLLLAVVLSFAAALPVLGCSLLLPTVPDKAGLDNPGLWLAVGSLSSIFLASTTAVVASTGAAVLTAVIVALMVGPAGGAWLCTTLSSLSWCTRLPSWALCVIAVCQIAFVVAGAHLLSTAAGGRRRRIVRGIVMAAAFVILTGAPVVLAWGRAIFFGTAAGRVGGLWLYPFPSATTSEYVAVTCDSVCLPGGGGNTSRAALLNVATGDWFWFDRYRVSFPVSWMNSWSPDGAKCLFHKGDRYIWPKHVLDPASFFAQSERLWPAGPTPPNWIFHAQTRTFTPAPVGRFDGWFDSSTLFGRRENGLVFHSTADDSTVLCRRPEPTTPSADAAWREAGWPMVTDVGVFLFRRSTRPDADGRSSALLWRFHPELDVAEVKTLTHTWQDPRLWPYHMARDGTWFVAVELGARGADKPYCLVSVNTGLITDFRMPAGSRRLAGPRLVPNRRQIAFLTSGGGALYDVGTGQWRTHSLSGNMAAPAEGRRLHGQLRCSPSGRYVAASTWTETSRSKPGPRGPAFLAAVDLQTGANWRLPAPEEAPLVPRWFGDDRLLLQTPLEVWVVNRDGADLRRLMP